MAIDRSRLASMILERPNGSSGWPTRIRSRGSRTSGPSRASSNWSSRAPPDRAAGSRLRSSTSTAWPTINARLGHEAGDDVLRPSRRCSRNRSASSTPSPGTAVTSSSSSPPVPPARRLRDGWSRRAPWPRSATRRSRVSAGVARFPDRRCQCRGAARGRPGGAGCCADCGPGPPVLLGGRGPNG